MERSSAVAGSVGCNAACASASDRASDHASRWRRPRAGPDTVGDPRDALDAGGVPRRRLAGAAPSARSEEHTSELQSHLNLVCRLLLEKKKYDNRLIKLRQSSLSHGGF